MSLIDTINTLCMRQLGRLPNLDKPVGYNDKIQWLKLNDQRPEQIRACDKLAVRTIVSHEYLIPLAESDEYPQVLKCNHDSGGTRLVYSDEQLRTAIAELTPRLFKPYGVDKGEWAYKYVKPVLYAEKLVEYGSVDYKMHCVHGRVAWIQVIWNRGRGATTEAILTPDGEPTGLHMDEKMISANDCPFKPDWRALTELAETLAQPYRYVRVDLYYGNDQPWFGELTFWPRAGCYKSSDELVFGYLLAIDMQIKLPRICE